MAVLPDPKPHTWRYVVTREWVEGPSGVPEEEYCIRELYFGENLELSWTEKPVSPYGDTWANCAADLERMMNALQGPVLDLSLDPPRLVDKDTLKPI